MSAGTMALRGYGLLGTLAVAVAIWGVLFKRDAATEEVDTTHAMSASEASAGVSADAGHVQTAGTSTLPLAGETQPGVHGWVQGYPWDPARPGIAISEADAAWLDSHGFPSVDVEMRLRGLPLPTLQDLANNGNEPAKAIYAYRIARQGAPRAQVLELLESSAMAGSVYALKTAGDIHMLVEGYQDPAMANAYYMLQARAGDQAGFAQGTLIDYHLAPEQRFRARVLEQGLWDRLALSEHADSPVRPGYDEFVETVFAAPGERP